ncbi:energy transducer TonB [Chryseobacterium arachidis]|nr:TonB family protein [Chryseobacterium arachidis]
MSKKLKPCENKSEAYYLKVLINEDASIKYLSNPANEESTERNKCAYDLAIQVINYMDKWNPAVVKGVKKQAIAGFFIVPDALFKNYKEGYLPHEDIASPKNIPDGIIGFRREVMQRININDFKLNNGFKTEVSFTVTKNGKIENIKLEPSSGDKIFDDKIITVIESFSNEWKPALKEGIPVDYKFRLPFAFVTN